MPHPNRPNDEAWLEHNYCALTGGYVESPNGQLTDCYRSTLLPPVAGWNPIEQNPVYAAAVLMLMIPRWREEGLHGDLEGLVVIVDGEREARLLFSGCPWL